jgi:hypothetical protein
MFAFDAARSRAFCAVERFALLVVSVDVGTALRFRAIGCLVTGLPVR